MSDDPGPGTKAAAQTGASGPDAPPPQAPWRLWLSMVIGIALAVPTGWFMALLAPLPGELGLFFFLICGLLIGAIMYRVGLPVAPTPRSKLYVTGLAVALALWMSSLLIEYWSLPKVAFGAVRSTIGFKLTPERKQQVEEMLDRHIQARLHVDDPPGGFIGYMRWAARSGEMSLPRVIDNSRVSFHLSQRRWRWVLRVGFSLIFTVGAILSQILPLGPGRPPHEPSEAEPGQRERPAV